jgi:hypothetical protein
MLVPGKMDIDGMGLNFTGLPAVMMEAGRKKTNIPFFKIHYLIFQHYLPPAVYHVKNIVLVHYPGWMENRLRVKNVIRCVDMTAIVWY